LINGK